MNIYTQLFPERIDVRSNDNGDRQKMYSFYSKLRFYKSLVIKIIIYGCEK